MRDAFSPNRPAKTETSFQVISDNEVTNLNPRFGSK